jgi:hypothetical protein
MGGQEIDTTLARYDFSKRRHDPRSQKLEALFAQPAPAIVSAYPQTAAACSVAITGRGH